jgi:hypothetical protein
VKFSVSLLAVSVFVFAACDTLATRRSLYSPSKGEGPFRGILREQSYLTGIEYKHLRPWTVKKKGETGTAASPLPGATLTRPKEETVAKPENL